MNPYLEWAKKYFQHKDIFKQEIDSISQETNKLVMYKKNGSEEIVTTEQTTNKEKTTWVLLENTREKLEEILKNWEIISKQQNTRLIFVDLDQNKFWLLHPYTHAKIADEKKLKEGLIALQDNC